MPGFGWAFVATCAGVSRTLFWSPLMVVAVGWLVVSNPTSFRGGLGRSRRCRRPRSWVPERQSAPHRPEGAGARQRPSNGGGSPHCLSSQLLAQRTTPVITNTTPTGMPMTLSGLTPTSKTIPASRTMEALMDFKVKEGLLWTAVRRHGSYRRSWIRSEVDSCQRPCWALVPLHRLRCIQTQNRPRSPTGAKCARRKCGIAPKPGWAGISGNKGAVNGSEALSSRSRPG